MYPFLYRVSTKSTQSLCANFLELISQYSPLSLLSMENGQPFAPKELAHFLQHHHIEHFTSSPHFPRSNGFIECQVRTLKTVLITGQDSHKTFEGILLDLWSPQFGPTCLPYVRSFMTGHSSTLVSPASLWTWRMWGTTFSSTGSLRRCTLIESMVPETS